MKEPRQHLADALTEYLPHDGWLYVRDTEALKAIEAAHAEGVLIGRAQGDRYKDLLVRAIRRSVKTPELSPTQN